MSQTERIFYILDLLMERGSFTRRSVAKHFSVSEKQIWRDKEYLKYRCPLSCGNLDIVYDRALRAYTLTEESLSALTLWRASSSLSVAKESAEGNSSAVSSNLVLSDASFITYKSYAKEDFSPFVYNRIMEALKKKRKIEIYYPTSLRHPRRIVEPLRLINYGEIWYLVACIGDSLLTYSLSRIKDVRVADEGAEFTDYESLERLLDGYGIYSSRAKEERIYVLHFHSWAISIVMNQIWQKDQEISLLDGGKTLEMRLPISDHTELLSRLLFYGDAAEAIAPDDFVSEYREKCKNMARRYGDV